MATYKAVTEGFQADLDLLAEEPDFSLKQQELEKFRTQELKKFDRANRGAVQEFDDLFAQCTTEKNL